MRELSDSITKAFEDRSTLTDPKIRAAIQTTIDLIDCGELRVAEKHGDNWLVNQWVKQAILLYFASSEMHEIEIGPFTYFDKIPLKKNFKQLGVRVVPPATARYGCFLERGVILMPSYVNIGAYVGAGTMVDTWATVGSCAQIGAGVHLSGGVGIGGVLEPPSAQPVIVEDGAFIGSRCVVVEGVRVREEAVLAANVTLTASTPIVDLRSSKALTLKGEVPPRAVVIPGTIPKSFPAGEFAVQCALIIGERTVSTDRKTSLNQVLREFAISV